jgi:hypothetical protein
VDGGLLMVVAFENLSGGMGTAAFVAFLMSLCNQRFTATQYALLSAFASVGRVWVGPLAGVLAESIGWPAFFIVSTVLALPALAMLWWLRGQRQGAGRRPTRRPTTMRSAPLTGLPHRREPAGATHGARPAAARMRHCIRGACSPGCRRRGRRRARPRRGWRWRSSRPRRTDARRAARRRQGKQASPSWCRPNRSSRPPRSSTRRCSSQAAQQRGAGARRPSAAARLRRIAARLIPHATRWNPRAAEWKWEVNLIGSKQINAFCMPGGKIAFYTGILATAAADDDEVATIMGHEIAHALREHARERMGKTAATRIGASVLSGLLGLGSAGDTLLNMGGQLLTLKFSREEAAARRHAAVRPCDRPHVAGTRRLLRRALRRAGVVPGLAHRRAERRLGHRPPGAPACAGRRAPGRRAPDGAAVGHLRAEAAAGLPAGQAGLRAALVDQGSPGPSCGPRRSSSHCRARWRGCSRASPSCCSATAR